MRIISIDCYNKFIFFILFINLTSAQSIENVLISGFGGQHDIDVASAFEQGYSSYNNTSFEGTITYYFDFGVENSFDYAIENGYPIIIRSMTGLSAAIDIAEDYPSVKLFMPAGSNSFIQVYSNDVISSPVIITAAGDIQNETGYKTEFYSPDPITGEPDLSSFSNGYIAGQITFIANILGISIDSARTLARDQSKVINPPDLYNGYGQINIASILISPFPVELISFEADLFEDNVFLFWETETEVNNYGFQVQRLNAGAEYIPSEEWLTLEFIPGNGNSNSRKTYEYIDENIPNGKFVYRLKQVDTDGKYTFYTLPGEIDNITITEATDISLSQEFKLEQNYPNPFNPSTNITFSIPYTVFVRLTIYSLAGQLIEILSAKKLEEGNYTYKWNAKQQASGIYFYTLETNKYSATKKMLLLR